MSPPQGELETARREARGRGVFGLKPYGGFKWSPGDNGCRMRIQNGTKRDIFIWGYDMIYDIRYMIYDI